MSEEEKGKVIPLGKNRFLIKFRTNREEIKIYKKFFLIFMIVCFIVSIISGFWIPRVYDITYISKSLNTITFFFLSIIFGILAILCELILKLNELEKRISELE